MVKRRAPTNQPTSMNVFAIRVSTGKRIYANDCHRKTDKDYARGTFSCIDCGSDVFVRRGNLRAWHFAHYNATDDQKCPHRNGGETVEHYEGKHFIAKNISRCSFVLRSCFGCQKGVEFSRRMPGGRELPASHCIAEVEKRISGTCKVADVALSDPVTGRQVASVEVLHTHAVDADKWSACRQNGISVLEVSTREIRMAREQHDIPGQTIPMRTTNMVHKLCTMCAWGTETTAVMWRECAVWDEYDKHWAEHGDQVYARLVEQKMKRKRAELEERIRARKRALVAKGREEAERRLHKSVPSRSTPSSRKQERTGVCKGKCRACGEWMWENALQNLCSIESSTVSRTAWDALFEGEDEKYRKRYTKGNEFNSLLVHGKCSMPCPACIQPCLLSQLAIYGLCFGCNVANKA